MLARVVLVTVLIAMPGMVAWSTVAALPAAADRSIAVTSGEPGRMDVFGLDINNQSIWHKSWNHGQWEPSTSFGWEVLPGGINFASSPGAVARGPDQLDVFGVDVDGQMWHRQWNGSQWLPLDEWEPLGGAFDGTPAVVSWGPDRLDVFALSADADGQVWHRAQDADAWIPANGWEPLGGAFNSSPAAVSWGVDRLDVFAIGTDNQTWHRLWNGSQWFPSDGWEPLGGAFNSTPAVVSWGPDRLDIFAPSFDGQMYHRLWNGTQWIPLDNEWEPLGGTFSSAPAAVSWGPDRLDVFGIGTDKQVWHRAWNGDGWMPANGWEALNGVFAGSPEVVSREPERLDVFAIGVDDQMWHRLWNGSEWLPSMSVWEGLGGTFSAPGPLSPQQVFLIAALPVNDSIAFRRHLVDPEDDDVEADLSLVLDSSGAFTFTGTLHNGNFFSTGYTVAAAVTTDAGLVFTFVASGRCPGVLADNDCEWLFSPTTTLLDREGFPVPNPNQAIRDNFLEISQGTFDALVSSPFLTLDEILEVLVPVSQFLLELAVEVVI